MTITSAIITLNEERNIERCIRSVLPFSDEVVVLDAFSTDKTKEICENLGVKFIQREWEGYAQSKNFLNAQASSDYIFSIDADEAVDAELSKAIIDVKKQNKGGIYSVNRLTNYCGHWIRHSGWYPDIKTRLFPKESCKWTGEYVHEELECSMNEEPQLLTGHLEHYSYYDFEDHRRRADKYSALTALKFHKRGKKAGALKPYLSGLGRFVSMYFIKRGFLDGKMGFKIAQISARSNVFKYQELRRLNKEND